MNPIYASDYAVYFDENGYDQLNSLIFAANYSKIVILVDQNTNEYCVSRFISQIATEATIEIIEIEAGAIHKNVETCIEIWNALLELEIDRKCLFINLGGGVVTDIGGFIAATYKRGVDCIQVPTTLLGMVDAAIGGKNGVDLQHLKNQIGTIVSPKMVLVDVEFLETLPQEEMRSGLAEMLKHGLIYDEIYWRKFLDLSSLEISDLKDLIYTSIDIKIKIVNQDPTENGIRKILNFGHTLGHAIESYFNEKENSEQLLHGEAVAIGMILESYISWKKNYLSAAAYLEIKKAIIHIYDQIVFSKSDIEAIIKLLVFDKKNENGQILFVLLENIGKCCINQLVEGKLIIDAFEDYRC